jgi:hypothetical protein
MVFNDVIKGVMLMTVSTMLISPGAALSLVQEGKPLAVIVVPSQALPVVSYAAEELQYHIEAATGAKLAIREESEDLPDGARVYLGNCTAGKAIGIDPAALPGNGYLIKTLDGALYLSGKDSPGDPLHQNTHAGTLFGVYELLEKHVGVRWLWPGKLGEVIPSQPNLSLPPLDETVEPLLWFKEWRDGHRYGEDSRYAEFVRQQQIWMRRQRFGRSVQPSYGHAFNSWWEQYGATHPEYFNQLPDGTRRLDPLINRGERVSMCVSAPGLWRQVLQNWEARGTPDFLSVCENDSLGACMCPTCLSWDEADTSYPVEAFPEGARIDSGERTPLPLLPFEQRIEATKTAFAEGDWQWPLQLGSLSDRYAKFYVLIAEEACKKNPNVKVVAYAYDNYRKPPVKATLHQHVFIGIVPSGRYNHDGYVPYGPDESEAFRQEWAGWEQTGCLLFLRPNYTWQGHNFPVFYARSLGEDLKFAMAHSMKGTDFDSLTGQYATQGPSLYMIATILNHPEAPVAEVLAEFYAAFGPAREAVAAYFSHWEHVYASLTADSVEMMGEAKRKYGGGSVNQQNFWVVAPEFYTPDLVARGWEFLAQARTQAAGDALASARVEWLASGLTQVELVLAAERAYENGVDTGDKTEFKQAQQVLAEFREQHWGENISNFAPLDRYERRLWNRTRNRRP